LREKGDGRREARAWLRQVTFGFPRKRSPPPQAQESTLAFLTVRHSLTATDLEKMGLPSDAAGAAAERLTSILQRSRGDNDPDSQVRLWLELRAFAEADPILRRAFPVHAALYQLAYEDRPKEAGPGPAWVPSRETIRKSNVAALLHDPHVRSYDELQRWSTGHREDFWSAMIERLGT